MGYQYLPCETLTKFCTDVFTKFHLAPNDANIIAEVILQSDLYGIESHGVQRLFRYFRALDQGTIDAAAKPETVFETPVSAVIDGHNAMGQLVGYRAMRLAIEKAKKSGICMVSVRNSNHYGIAGYYAKMACEEGLIGISSTNTNPMMVPTNGCVPLLGTNPIAFAIPAEPYPFLFDAATTAITRGKVEVYNKLGKALHEGWAVDADGEGATEASAVLGRIAHHENGGLLPLGGMSEESGGHKGYGYAMLCEFFAACLSLGTTSDCIGADGKAGVCHFFTAVDPSIFGDADAIRAHFERYLQTLRESAHKKGCKVYTHGEKEIAASQRILRDGVPVNDNTMAEFAEICKGCALDFAGYFGAYRVKENRDFGGNFY